MGRLKRFVPPGMGISSIRRWTVGAIVIAFGFSVSFLITYSLQLHELMRNMEQPVFSGLSMKPFRDMIDYPMILFRLAPVVPLMFIPGYYQYFNEETKSIYLMKRVKSPLEIHLRSFAIPVMGAALVVAVGCVVYFVYQFIYYTCTPEILLPASL